ncbi:Ankyrin-2 [Lambiella insularis]|nr:Ankyrin-2 [Lambiella insularis]
MVNHHNELLRAIVRAKDAILELEKVIEYGLLVPSNGPTVKVNRLFWMRKESEIVNKMHRLRDAKSDLSIAVGLYQMELQITTQLHLVQLQVGNQSILSSQQMLGNMIDSRLPEPKRGAPSLSGPSNKHENNLQQATTFSSLRSDPVQRQAINFRIVSSERFRDVNEEGESLLTPRPTGQFGIFGSELELDHFQFTLLHAAVLVLSTDGATAEEIIRTTPRNLINNLDQLGRTARSWACTRNDLRKVKELLKMGADPNIADSEGRTALHHSATNSSWPGTVTVHESVLDELLDHGADIDVRNRRGGAPLHDFTLLSDCTASSIEKFFFKDADLNARDIGGWTPMHWAVRHGNIEVIDKLVEYGANMEIQNEVGITPLTYALIRHQFETFAYLLDLGCDYNVRTKSGSTLLHLSARDGDIDVLRFLAQRDLGGLNPDDRDEDNVTAHERAERRGDGVYEWVDLVSHEATPVAESQTWYEAFLALEQRLKTTQENI